MNVEMSGRDSSWRRLPVGLVTIYTATALLGTALFFFLHYLGNQIPYELAQRRFAVVFEADRTEWHTEWHRGDCQTAVAIIAGAHRDAAYTPLVDAVLMKGASSVSEFWDYCSELQAASVGMEWTKVIEKTRYWWGHKALSAIALRYLTVPELYRLILVAGFGAWLLLAAAVAPMGWRALLVASPTITFGVAFSDIVRFTELAHGISYSWAVLASALLALLLLRPATARWAPWFCFVTGMTSSYLWFFDGHTTLALFLIGLVGWLGYERLGSSGGARRAAGCIGLYIAGFVLCFALGQVTKSVVHEWLAGGSDLADVTVARNVSGQASFHWDRMVAEMTGGAQGAADFAKQGCVGCHVKSWLMLPIVREFTDFHLIMPLGWTGAMVLSVFSLLALASAAAVAIGQARRGRRKLARSVLWLVALALLVLVQFLLPNDIPFRESRFVFLVLATCWTCLVLAMMQLDRRSSSVLAGCLVGGLVSGIAAANPVAERLRLFDPWIDQWLAATRHIIQSDFDVYLNTDNWLIYVKDECRSTDIESRFFLHMVPVDPADLPEPRRRHGFDYRDFDFRRYGGLVGGRCLAKTTLPQDYDVAEIRTGQYVPGSGRIWEASAAFLRFSVSLDETGRRVVYAKDECSGPDVEARFFLHVIPVDPADLPEPRRRHGFDNLDFDFGDHGALVGGRCFAERSLPDYDIATVRTGQYDPGGRTWTAEIDLEE